MHQLREAVETILWDDIPGDLIETGVWRGGACMMMREVLREYGNTTRKVYLADSFCGLPEPNPAKYPADRDDPHWMQAYLRISLDEVKSNFTLPDSQVVFVQGWFKDTLPKLDTTFSLLRLDGDMYESTWDALTNLYDKLSPSGFVIIDDWLLSGCRKAVEDFWGAHPPDFVDIDGASIYWRK
jgi:O-methyltransferase